jgi:hypothetical protein
MHAFHIAVTVVMAVFGLAALAAIYGPVPYLLAISFYFGLWVLTAAIIIALTLVLILIVRAVNKEAKPFLRRTWLGLANGTVAVVFLGWFAIYVS